MAVQDERQESTSLEQIKDISNQHFTIPTKRINDGSDLEFFFTSLAFHDLRVWLLQLNRAAFPSRFEDGTMNICRLDDLLEFPPNVSRARRLLDDLTGMIHNAPPDTGPRRFGNVAFRSWYALMEEQIPALLRSCLEQETHRFPDELYEELQPYFIGSFGSPQRLDYGTGHELNFLAFLGCLWKLGVFAHGQERAIIVGIIQPYLTLVRRLITTYTLEPAGSHGVWGLDDHSFVPYIFGSAQLGPAVSAQDNSGAVPTEGSLPTAPKPSSVTDVGIVGDLQKSNMYFSAIQFIYDVKRGPFWEHSPVLYDVSGIKDGWGKINKGMLKMYAAEVLGKFPVVQHFPFGSLFRWECGPRAKSSPANIHVQHQPLRPVKEDVARPPQSGTQAPWAKPSTSGGMPTSRFGPSIVHGQSSARKAPAVNDSHLSSAMKPTTAPWANATVPQELPTSTLAPWARKNERDS